MLGVRQNSKKEEEEELLPNAKQQNLPNKLKNKCNGNDFIMQKKKISPRVFFFLFCRCTFIHLEAETLLHKTQIFPTESESERERRKKTAAFLMANPILKMDLQHNRNCMPSIDFINLM